MSDDEFHAYIGLLIFSSLVLCVVAIRGFGQSVRARIVDGLFSVAFLGYAGYLVVAEPGTVLVSYYAFAAPVLALGHAVRHGKARRTTEPVHGPGQGHVIGYNIDPVPAPPPATLAYLERLGGVPAGQPDIAAPPWPGQPAPQAAQPAPQPAPPAPQPAPAATEPPSRGGPAFLPPAAPVLQTVSAQPAAAAPAQPPAGQRAGGRHRADP